MFSVSALRVLQIKDLKDLRFFTSSGTIDMQVLKDLKRCFLMRTLAGDRPPRYEPGKGFSSPCARSGAGAPELQSLQGPLGP